MKHFLFSLFIVLSTIATTEAQTAYTCGTTTQAGTPCKRVVSAKGVKCWQHGGQTKAQAAGTSTTTTCGAKTKTTGAPCKNRVKGGGRCYLHKG